MKITIFLNNKDLDLNFSIIRKIYNENDLFILRGEPSLRKDLHRILNLFKKKNYILTTDLSDLDNLIKYKKTIPYISINWEGLFTDNKKLLKALNYFSSKETQLRLNYTIGNKNIDWIEVDIVTLRNFLKLYPKMKRPYILLYQQGEYFNHKNFIWPPLNKEIISIMNKNSILTQKTLNSLNAWEQKKTYNCIAPQNEIIVNVDGTIRTCMSHRFKEILGDLNIDSLESILEKSKEKRENHITCPFREQCWLTFHHKDNIK